MMNEYLVSTPTDFEFKRNLPQQPLVQTPRKPSLNPCFLEYLVAYVVTTRKKCVMLDDGSHGNAFPIS